jgi:glycosyltransferase involved in cell wall biosynthesis
MKILELHYTLAPGGAERFMVDLSNELCKTNEVTVCTSNSDTIGQNAHYKKDLSPQIKYMNIGSKRGHQMKALWGIYKIIRKEKPDIVHAHSDVICLYLPALLYRKPKYFHTLHNLAEKCLEKKILKSVNKWFYRKRVQPITISKICLESYEKLYGLFNAIKVDNGSPFFSKSIINGDTRQEVESLKINPDDKVFIHVARYALQKNQQLLITAFNYLLMKEHHAILLIIGDGYDTPDGQNLLAGAQKGIYWLGVKNNVQDYLQLADFFILSSSWEGLPIALLEAMACGVIPVCTPAGGIPDVVIHKKTGFVSSGFEFEDFYHTINEAIQLEKTVDREFLKQYFQANFSMGQCALQYDQCFKQ